MRKEYPSDISREQFEEIRPILESARKKTKPRQIELYELFCAVLYKLYKVIHFSYSITNKVVKCLKQA